MPRSFAYIYDKINSQNERKYSIKATYYEIYNEKVILYLIKIIICNNNFINIFNNYFPFFILFFFICNS